MFSRKKLVLRNRSHPAVNTIPPYRKKLLFISNEQPRGHGYGLQVSISITQDREIDINKDIPDDPSTIYSSLPAIDAKQPEDTPKLGYFPSYSEMEPEQRGKYLRWLCDVTNHIDIGYVFVFYYGLERHLVNGEFDAAFDEILLLREHHENSSFQSYSASALVHSCLLRKRVDKLQQIYSVPGFDYFGNSNLLLLHQNRLDILPDMMFQLATQLTGVNRRYIKLQPKLYLEQIAKVLNQKFGKPSYPLSAQVSLEGIEGIPYPIFANISFPPEVRTPRLPNLLRDESFQARMNLIFKEVHEAVKAEAAHRRKNA